MPATAKIRQVTGGDQEYGRKNTSTITGMSAMRPSVSKLGQVSSTPIPRDLMSSICMEESIDALRQFAADARHAGQVFDAGAGHALQAAEMLQECLPPLRSQARHLLQRRGIACFGTALPVA